MTWNMKSLDVSTLFDRAIKSMAGITTNDDIEIILRKNSDTIPVITGDEDRIFQVVTNLLSNAIKFTEKGVIICSVEVKSDYIQCFVKDSGLGIAEQDLVPHL